MNGFTPPATVDRLTIFAALLAVLALASFVSGITRMLTERRARVFRLLGGPAILLAALAVFAVAGWAQTYRALIRNQLVATVTAVPVPGKAQTMQVVFTPMLDGKSGRAKTFTIRGDEWQLGGDVVTWQDWLNILGVHTGYRITQLDGYYENPNDYKTRPVTRYDLGSAHDTVSEFQHQHANLMAFVRTTHGNGVRMLPSPAIYQVYLSTSGYWAAQS